MVLNGEKIDNGEFENIKESILFIGNNNTNNDIKSEQLDAAYYWGKIESDLPIKKEFLAGKLDTKWKYLKKVFFKLSKIIKIIFKIFDNQDNKINIKLCDKIKYYQILSDKENEDIINLLTQSINDKNNDINNDENININNDNDNLDISHLKKLKDIEDKIKKLTEQNKDNSQEHELEKIKFYKNLYIENLEKITLDENKRIQVIQEQYRGGFFGKERKRKVQILDSDIHKTIYLDNEANQEKIEDIYLQQEIVFIDKDNSKNHDKDPKFYPEKNSLCPSVKVTEYEEVWFLPLPYRLLNSDIENWDNINWRKIKGKEIFSKNKEPSLDNIRQGEYIGDYYFLSALGALCDRKNYLKLLIKRIVIGGESIGYSVKLNLNGKWKNVIVDKYFPYLKDKNMLCFGSSFQNELWVSLFEKAWAKVNGCYAKIGCGGECGDGFDVLTSAISEYYLIVGTDDKKKEKLWEILKDAKNKKNNYVIGAGTRGFSFFEKIWGIIGILGNYWRWNRFNKCTCLYYN